MKALTIGGAMVDTLAIIDDDLIERISMSNSGKTFLLLEQGSKTEASSISTHCGGGALNAAVSLARLGFTVSTLVKVGRDQRASLVRELLLAEGIETTSIATAAEAPTGSSIIVSAHDRNAAVFTFRGANTLLTPADLDVADFNVDLAYVSPLSGASSDMLPHIISKARACGAKIAVNPGVRQIATRFTSLCELLPSIDILALNRLEAETLVRQAVAELAGSENATLRRIVASSLGTVSDIHAASRHTAARALISGLRDLGANTVLLTDGKHGAYAGHAHEIVHCEALNVPVVSTVGAGDAFVSTFAGMLIRNDPYDDALIAAIVNSAAVVGDTNAQSGLLRLKALVKRTKDARTQIPILRWPSKE